ncbi:MAG TPA: hypothetical protein VJM49_06355, partial [Acidimicrobiales bacterium]|nr:hypothetical protein [Acidimicrobiales bacterium]
MSRPHRYGPPRPGRPLVKRSDLLRRAQSRWEHPVSVVVGGAGFGKSSLLVQACDENRLAPRGDDCWLGCDAGDADPRTFALGLATALGADPSRLPDAGEDDAEALAGPLADAIWARSPRQVCLIVDDLHEIGDGPAARVLAALVEALPGNGHLVLSSRVDPPVPLARLIAQGRVVRLDEGDLAFGDDDLEAFASLRSVPLARLDDVGGWPALVELRSATAGATVDDFLTEEVLAALGPAEARVVATVAVLGGADQELLDAVAGPGTDLAAVMAPVPLVSADGTGWYAVHALWADRLAGELDDADRREVQRRGGRALAARDLVR